MTQPTDKPRQPRDPRESRWALLSADTVVGICRINDAVDKREGKTVVVEALAKRGTK